MHARRHHKTVTKAAAADPSVRPSFLGRGSHGPVDRVPGQERHPALLSFGPQAESLILSGLGFGKLSVKTTERGYLNGAIAACPRHNEPTNRGYTTRRDPHGRWHVYRPDGTELTEPPTGHDCTVTTVYAKVAEALAV